VAEGFSPHSGGTVPDSHRVPQPIAGFGGRETTIRRVAASRVLSVWLPVVAWAGLIFTLSSIPDLGTGLGGWDLVLRKLAHTAEYAVLGLLLMRALEQAAVAFAVGVAFAVTDEIHQAFVPGRHGAPLDVLIDAAGVAIGVLVALRLRR
jgi:VanZ family protein